MAHSQETAFLYQDPAPRRIETPPDTESIAKKLSTWHPPLETNAYVERDTGIEQTSEDPEEHAYFLEKVEQYKKKRQDEYEKVALALERVTHPKQYLVHLQRTIDSEIRWVKDPLQELAELTEVIREPETAAEICVAAEHWNQRFPVIEVPDDEVPTIKYRQGYSFLHIAAGFMRDSSGFPTRPLDLMYDIQDTFLTLEELYEIERQHPEHRVAYSWSSSCAEIQRRGHLAKLLDIYRASVNKPTPMVYAFIDGFERYEKNHPVSAETVDAFKQRLLPAIERGDEDARILATCGNIFGMKKGHEGAGDFIMRCYVGEVDQPTLLQLCLDAESIPALDYSVRNQNVQDGLGLVHLGILRDQIHDQMPGTHAIVNAMIAYYEDPNHDPEPLRATCRTSRSYFSAGYRPDCVEHILDLQNYDRITTVRSADGTERQERTIDVLRRVAKNTQRPFEQGVPCPLPEVATAHDEITRAIHEQRRIPSQESLELIRSLNHDLQKRLETKTPSLTPSYIRFVVWTDQLAFHILQDYRFEEQLGAYKTPLFKEMLRFHELRYANPYDETAFETWYAKLLNPDRTDQASTYQAIAQHVLGHIANASRLLQFSHREHQQDLLWSGNLADQLIGFVDMREATTAIGKRKRSELQGGAYTE